MSPARAILLEVGGMGMVREILFKQDYFQDPRRASILVDELNGLIWIWIGTDIKTKTRNQLLPVAEKIREEGYTSKMDGLTIGQNCSEIIIIDQRELNNQGVEERHQKALSIFNLNFIEEGRFVVQFQAGPAVKKDVPREKALAGILIASILEDSPEIFIGLSSLGVYSVESSQGTIKFKIHKGNIQLLEGSIELNDKIQRAFQQNIKDLL